MEQVKRIKLLCTPSKLEVVPEEMIHNIQSLLPVKDAARTSVLSKSWLQAWSTIPTLRFDRSIKPYRVKCEQPTYIIFIDRTLLRYLRENIPIISFLLLHFHILDLTSLSFANKWIRAVAYKSCLTELHLNFVVNIPSVSLPNEIFSGENLCKISVIVEGWGTPFLRMSTECLNLRELELIHVNISQEVLDNLLSTCSLLEKIRLSFLMGTDTIKVTNLRYLRELIIESKSEEDITSDSDDDDDSLGSYHAWGLYHTLEIYDVPNLHRFSCKLPWNCPSFNVGLLGSVRDLYLAPVFMDDRIANLIRSKFPLLESLTLHIIDSCLLENLDITCASLKRLKIRLQENRQINIQVHAPKLLSFRYTGKTIPSLLFPTIVPQQIKLSLELMNPIDCSFFLDLREKLNLSSNFVIKISSFRSVSAVPFDVHIDDLRTMVPFPATNVKKLMVKFTTYSDNTFWEYSSFFDAVFSICHPIYIKASHLGAERISWRLLLKAILEKKTTKEYLPHLKEIEAKVFCFNKWETLTSLWIEANVFYMFFEFRLTWCSP